jgi:hypothetical protein
MGRNIESVAPLAIKERLTGGFLLFLFFSQTTAFGTDPVEYAGFVQPTIRLPIIGPKRLYMMIGDISGSEFTPNSH